MEHGLLSAKLLDRRWFRVLTEIDRFTRECLAPVADGALNGHVVALALSQVVAEHGTPESITADNELIEKQRPAKGTHLRWLADEAIGATIAR